MEIKYLSPSEEASFAELIHDGGELADLFAQMMVSLEVDTDFDTVMISFDSERVLRFVVEDSPYVVVMDEDAQRITLYSGEEEDSEWDFDDDGIENVVDLMASRILTSEQHVY